MHFTISSIELNRIYLICFHMELEACFVITMVTNPYQYQLKKAAVKTLLYMAYVMKISERTYISNALCSKPLRTLFEDKICYGGLKLLSIIIMISTFNAIILFTFT